MRANTDNTGGSWATLAPNEAGIGCKALGSGYDTLPGCRKLVVWRELGPRQEVSATAHQEKSSAECSILNRKPEEGVHRWDPMHTIPTKRAKQFCRIHEESGSTEMIKNNKLTNIGTVLLARISNVATFKWHDSDSKKGGNPFRTYIGVKKLAILTNFEIYMYGHTSWTYMASIEAWQPANQMKSERKHLHLVWCSPPLLSTSKLSQKWSLLATAEWKWRFSN